MSLKLEQDSSPNLAASNNVMYHDSTLFFATHKPGELPSRMMIGPKDMAALVLYWMTNTDLNEDPETDPRYRLVEQLTHLKPSEGNPGRIRLELP